jgi:drug/metabolite transporter (DMT)-like permease
MALQFWSIAAGRSEFGQTRQASSSAAGALLYSQPVFVAVLAYIFLDERLYLYHVVGASCILVGVLLVMLLKRQPVGSAAVRSKAEG